MSSTYQETAVISGASSGIGAEIARTFSSKGHAVLLLGRDSKKLEKIRLEMKTPVETVAFDFANKKLPEAELREKLSQLPRVSFLVNNAAIYQKNLFQDASDEEWTLNFEVNLMSVVRMTRFIWPYFVQQKHGSIVNISSTLGLKPIPETSVYSCLKAALNNLTQAMAQEGGPHNIRANAICPGLVDTPIHPFHNLPAEEKKKVMDTLNKIQLIERVGTPHDIAEMVYFLSSVQSSWTTGSIVSVDGGVSLK